MLRKLQTAIIILIIPIGGFLWYADHNDIALSEFLYPGRPVVHVGDYPVYVEIADTKETRERGLSGKKEIGPGWSGMFFIFDEPSYHGIWMKDMQFPIDIIWISEDLRIVAITENVSPDSYPRIFEPPVPVKYVLETKPQYADTLGITIGDGVVIPNKYLR